MATEQKKAAAVSEAELRKQAVREDEARLDETLQDTTDGPNATVLRENAQLHLQVRHERRRNLRVWSVVIVQSIVLGVVFGSAYFWFPKYKWIATTDNHAVCGLSTSDDPTNITAATVEDFAKDAAINSYTYDYVSYRKSIDEAADRWYSASGRKAYLKSLDESGNIARIVKGRLIMRAFATNAPQLETEGTSGGVHFWTVEAPVAIQFFANGDPAPKTSQDWVAVVQVVQVPASARNVRGIAVESVVLKPGGRTK